MPKEVIHSAHDQFHLEIAWKRGSHVQAGLVIDDMTVAELVETWDDDDKIMFDGLWVTLDVPDIDRLMKVLRRARTQLLSAPSEEIDDAYKPLPDTPSPDES